MEDRYAVISNEKNNIKCSFYAIFDGHGGSSCSQFCVNNFFDYFCNSIYFDNNPIKAIYDTFERIDKDFLNTSFDCILLLNY